MRSRAEAPTPTVPPSRDPPPKGFGRPPRPPGVPPPRWLVDEMLGRLARYLRFVGCDTVYVRGASDDELLERAARERRILLTRDRLLSRRSPSALLLESSVLADQWRSVRAAWPAVPTEVAFARCSLCNGELRPRPVGEEAATDTRIPAKVRAGGGPLFACAECGHLYWEGSHTASIRSQIAAWERGGRT